MMQDVQVKLNPESVME